MGCLIKSLEKYLKPLDKQIEEEDDDDEEKHKKNNIGYDNNKSESVKLKLKSKNKNSKNNLKEKELLNKLKKDLDKRETDLKKSETKLQNEKNKFKEEMEKEKIIIEKQKTLLKEQKEENEKNNKLILIDNDIEDKKENYKKKESDLKEKEEELKKREDELKLKEEDIQKKQDELINKENILNDEKSKLDILNGKIMNEKSELNLLKIKEQELIKREKTLADNEKMKEPILIGLNNIGATCYMNASLQCLSNTKRLTKYFLNDYKEDSNKIMSNEYYIVLQNLWKRENNNKAYSPNSFKEVLSKENPLFAGIQANDSKDLINFLIERFHQELNIEKNDNNNNAEQPDQTNEQLMLKVFLNEFKNKFNSPISNLFYGILETKSQCQGCNVIKFNFQIFSFIEFPLQQVNQYFFNKGKRPLLTDEGKNPDVDLYECFEYNEKVDLMTGDNQMFCNQCNKLNNAYYSSILYSGPKYLIINLNRGKGAVYECKVIFPEQLNIFNFVTFKQGITVYELYGVICHLGPSSMSGHFVAYCRNRIDNKWYLYNDGIVTLCTRPQQYNDGMPYILFYKELKGGQDSDY